MPTEDIPGAAAPGPASPPQQEPGAQPGSPSDPPAAATHLPPDGTPGGTPDPGGGRRRRTVRAVAVGAVAVVACAALVRGALSLAGGPAGDGKPVADGGAGACAYTPSGAARPAGIPVFDEAKAARPYMATLTTDQGPVTFAALTSLAPCTTYSFRFLAEKKYFDGSSCRRLTTRSIFTLECGGDRRGSADPGYHFPDENLAEASYPAGTVAMAKAEPGRNGSRFFLAWADPAVPMGPEWTPFGTVVDGMEVLRRIAAKGTADGSADGRPAAPVVVRGVSVQEPR
ncbi:peptidylprolyl isomerase [Streptomyces sp. WAC06614]|uniref:peptidylprolyl isomerase n=1 Tax=Streptomyces sp. WAC06614 TaxID=2487416 RepID=UPI000F784A15|nr:peptidylprolyl isomerase [Streptomyces sp. WAC06614]RSS82131.1 peptidylprolyl isomerase [Streptomyces sp. WAC06614]